MKGENITKYSLKSAEKIVVHAEEKLHGIEILALLPVCCSKQFATPANIKQENIIIYSYGD